MTLFPPLHRRNLSSNQMLNSSIPRMNKMGAKGSPCLCTLALMKELRVLPFTRTKYLRVEKQCAIHLTSTFHLHYYEVRALLVYMSQAFLWGPTCTKCHYFFFLESNTSLAINSQYCIQCLSSLLNYFVMWIWFCPRPLKFF